jgi:lambda family phage portal protein
MPDGRHPWRSEIKTLKPKSKRMYAAAKAGRLDFRASSSSADGELYTSLAQLRNKSRALVRDVVYAKRAQTVVVNNTVGSGVGLQAQVKAVQGDKLFKRINDGIERAWKKWARAEYCHTGGSLHFADIERLCMAEVFEAGEVLIRMHPNRFGQSEVPLAVEVIEAERIADDHSIQPRGDNIVTMGVEHDEYGRPVAYHVHKQHPVLTKGYARGEILRIPAEQILHLKLVDRWPQARGVPMLHSAIGRLNQLGEFENAALVASRIGASKVGFFEPTEWNDAQIEEGEEADGTPNMTVQAGEFMELPPGYKFNSWDPAYPHENFDPFTRAALRGIAAGTNVSYESISRDYSQSNYSSSRLSLLEDRDNWRALQQWWVRSFREPLHRKWLQAAVFAGQIPEIDTAIYAQDTERFEAVRWKLRGWGWVDPAKEVAAYKEAERAGYKTKADIIAETAGGADLEDTIAARRYELDALEDAGLSTDTTNEASAEPIEDEPVQFPMLQAVGSDVDDET